MNVTFIEVLFATFMMKVDLSDVYSKLVCSTLGGTISYTFGAPILRGISTLVLVEIGKRGRLNVDREAQYCEIEEARQRGGVVTMYTVFHRP